MLKPNDQMQAVLDAHKEMGPLPIETLTAEQARQIPLADRATLAVYGQHFMKRALAPMPLPVGRVEHCQIPGKQGNIIARLYTPKGEAPKSGWPVLVYYHGGGWVLGTLDTYDSSARGLCEAAKCIVLSCHYRQAPEHQWPAAYEDAYTAYEWAQAHAKHFSGNPAKIAIGGESAGGNLAAVVSQIARDERKTLPIHQLLIYPVTDLVNGPDSLSAQENLAAKPLNTPMLHWFYNYYVPNLEDRTHPYASPIMGDLTGLPPATIILAQIDPLLSEGEDYANRLDAVGVPVSLSIYEGVTHEFFGMGGIVDEATDAIKFAAECLKDAFESKLRVAEAA